MKTFLVPDTKIYVIQGNDENYMIVKCGYCLATYYLYLVIKTKGGLWAVGPCKAAMVQKTCNKVLAKSIFSLNEWEDGGIELFLLHITNTVLDVNFKFMF